jgi:hypothetical protein
MKLRITKEELAALQLVTDHIVFVIQGGLEFKTKGEYLRYLSYIAVLYASWSLPILIQLYQLNAKPLEEAGPNKPVKFDANAVKEIIEELETRVRKAIGDEWQTPNPEKYREQIVNDLRKALIFIARPTAKGE